MTDGGPLWYWFDVALWLGENGIIGESDMRDAQNLAIINSILEAAHQRNRSPEIAEQILAELC